MVKILAALVAALSILNSSGATEKVAALVERATCSGASHSSVYEQVRSLVNGQKGSKNESEMSTKVNSKNRCWRNETACSDE